MTKNPRPMTIKRIEAMLKSAPRDSEFDLEVQYTGKQWSKMLRYLKRDAVREVAADTNCIILAITHRVVKRIKSGPGIFTFGLID